MLDHHLDRLEDAGLPIVLATTINDTDDPIVDLANRRKVSVFRGSEKDVLSRFVGAAEAFEFDAIVRVTSDCPLIDPALIIRGVQAFCDRNDPWLYVSNALTRTYPRGMDFEVFSRRALQLANNKATATYQREHVTPFFYQMGDPRIRLENIAGSSDMSAYRVTLDTPEDYALLKRLIEDYEGEALTVEGIVSVLAAHPDLASINRHVEQKKLGE
jgi:spore coat polysaccharide biosynthesis protein SpsF